MIVVDVVVTVVVSDIAAIAAAAAAAVVDVKVERHCWQKELLHGEAECYVLPCSASSRKRRRTLLLRTEVVKVPDVLATDEHPEMKT